MSLRDELLGVRSRPRPKTAPTEERLSGLWAAGLVLAVVASVAGGWWWNREYREPKGVMADSRTETLSPYDVSGEIESNRRWIAVQVYGDSALLIYGIRQPKADTAYFPVPAMMQVYEGSTR